MSIISKRRTRLLDFRSDRARRRMAVRLWVLVPLIAIVMATAGPGHAKNAEREVCVSGSGCVTVKTPRASTALYREGRAGATTARLGGDRCTSWTYLGVSPARIEGGTVKVVRSQVNRSRWHYYKRSGDCVSQCTARAKAFPVDQRLGLSYVYTWTRPTCDSTGRLVVADVDLPEDGYGWSCFTDGNQDCGSRLAKLDAGCVTDQRDGYTMCRDGRVYLRVSKGGKVARQYVVYRVLA